MAAISSRSALESERVDRPRIFCTNLLSAAVTAGSTVVCGPVERPRVNGFFSGASARTIWSSVTFLSWASAVPAPKEIAAPNAATETIAVKVFAAEIFAIACPLLRLPARFQHHSNEQPDLRLRPAAFL